MDPLAELHEFFKDLPVFFRAIRLIRVQGFSYAAYGISDMFCVRARNQLAANQYWLT
jgi:hypothetical protein